MYKRSKSYFKLGLFCAEKGNQEAYASSIKDEGNLQSFWNGVKQYTVRVKAQELLK